MSTAYPSTWQHVLAHRLYYPDESLAETHRGTLAGALSAARLLSRDTAQPITIMSGNEITAHINNTQHTPTPCQST